MSKSMICWSVARLMKAPRFAILRVRPGSAGDGRRAEYASGWPERGVIDSGGRIESMNEAVETEAKAYYTDQEINEIFHRLWTKAVTGDPYVKSEWILLQRMLNTREVLV